MYLKRVNMNSYDKILTRLILILTKLSNDEAPTIKELSIEFNVKIRTIQRDIYERLAYFPIEKTKLKTLKFIDGFSLDKSTLKKDELLIVYLALTQVQKVNHSFKDKIEILFSKLFTPDYKMPYHIKSSSFQELDFNSSLVKNIIFCIENKYITKAIFKNKKVHIHPYKIVSFSGIWYLLAKDIQTNKTKSFLIHEMQNIIHLNKKYSREEPIDEILENVHSAWFDEGICFDVTIYVHREVAYYFKLKNILPTQKILQENKDGTLIITFKVSHYEDIDNIIKAWLPHIEVLEPIDYHEKIKTELSTYLERLSFQKNISIIS